MLQWLAIVILIFLNVDCVRCSDWRVVGDDGLITTEHAKTTDTTDTNTGTDGDCGCGNIARESFLQPLNTQDSSVALESQVQQVHSEISRFPTEDMIYIEGGESFIGTDKPELIADGEGPLRTLTLSPYYIDRYAVTNEDFLKFVEDTNFLTENDKFGWSFVFHSAIPAHIKQDITQAVLGAEWWLPVKNTTWKSPEGLGSNVFSSNRHRHPVVQVTWNDARAFCKWRGARLPTEAEWEHAARGPLGSSKSKRALTKFPWGNVLVPPEGHRMNVFQGKFPSHNTKDDGFEFTAPVDSFGQQNEYGVYNMIGNVWEWVEDWHTVHHDIRHAVNPQGPAMGKEKVKKGGSFLCHRSYCYRYRIVARFPSTPDSAASNIGFRCAKSVDDTTKREL